MSGGLKKVRKSKSKKDDDVDMKKWTVCVKEDEDDDDWDVLDNKMYDDKGSARQASADARDDYDKRKVIAVKYSNLS